jgi:peptidoglycan lytic transglycosylase
MLFVFRHSHAVRSWTCAVAGVAGLLAIFAGAAIGLTSAAGAKTPGSTYCFYRKCHRVKTLSEMRGLVGKTRTLTASFYDACHRDRYNPCGLTSSGEQFYPHRADNAASPIYPDGTRLLVWSPISKQAAVVRINNAGPYWGNRTLDVSRALAERLGFKDRGVAKVEVRILAAPTKSEARYKRKRSYRKVRGPIGHFSSLDEAHNGLMVLLAFDAMASSMMAPVAGNAVTSVERPFEVAAQAFGGNRLFAALSEPKLAAWPVVAPKANEEPNAVIRVAAIDWPVVTREVKIRAKHVVRLASLSGDWPVVARSDDQVSGPVVTRLASAKHYKSRRIRRSVAASEPPVRLRQPWRKTRSASRAARRATVRKKKGDVRRNAKKSAAKTKSKAIKRVQVKRSLQKKRRPSVATRNILHKALGRSG